ncbi:hypothetical protein [Luteolibacter marinus]|uniref:hypothetical protein n=1 Tax=Luteolibacter marinus TaxID=2776705 RepID=UPI001868133C|nr:hypothetical protein [Luteolibacter marinus]
MKHAVALICLAAPLAAAPTDVELLAFVKERGRQERVTPAPVKMAKAVAERCSIDAVLGKRTHGAAAFHVYANEPAALPIFDPWGSFPEGSLVLKEKLGRDDGATQLFTGMLKRERGYFPECGDWEFFTVDAAATRIVERGKIARCAECHEDYPKGDHVTKVYAAPVQLSGGRIVLHASTAEVHGEKLQYEEKEVKNTLGFWVNAADHASWEFEVMQPGTYEIHLWQGCGKGSGGAEVAIGCAGRTCRFTVEDTGHFQNFKERKIGTLRFDKAGPQVLEVKALSKPGVAVMDLRQIVLVPVKP